MVRGHVGGSQSKLLALTYPNGGGRDGTRQDGTGQAAWFFFTIPQTRSQSSSKERCTQNTERTHTALLSK